MAGYATDNRLQACDEFGPCSRVSCASIVNQTLKYITTSVMARLTNLTDVIADHDRLPDFAPLLQL
jgi:hypothetical protein